MLHPYSMPEKQRERLSMSHSSQGMSEQGLPPVVKSSRREVALIQGASAHLNAVNMCKSLLLYCSTLSTLSASDSPCHNRNLSKACQDLQVHGALAGRSKY